ncbi:SGNH/GDSL hydrolase family protein [Streptomyces sp. NPDC002004]
MRKRSLRSRGVVAVVSAALLGVTGLTGCDTESDNSRSTQSSSAHGKQKPRRAPVWNRSPSSIAAVGDSITRGFDACTVLSDCPEVSWATGSDDRVRSLAVRLLGKQGAAEHSWNHAVTGARMADLPAQMAQAAGHRPQLVTVMVGANDACRSSARAMTSVDAFRSEFEDALHTLRRRLPKSQVYVASVPDLLRLWSQGRTNPLGRQVWKLGICPSMLQDADAVDPAANARRSKVRDRVVAYNKVLRDVCAKDARCRYDEGAVFDYRFDGEQLSQWDWFHPSRDGQSRLAEIAYREVTARKPETL